MFIVTRVTEKVAAFVGKARNSMEKAGEKYCFEIKFQKHKKSGKKSKFLKSAFLTSFYFFYFFVYFSLIFTTSKVGPNPLNIQLSPSAL